MRRGLGPVLILTSPLLGRPAVFAGQDARPEGGTGGVAVATARPVDPRFRTPRATARTFLIATNLAEDDPHRIFDLAGLGIGGLAFVPWAQDSLKNLFGSLMQIADRTFRVGDVVKIGANEGVVESVGLRTARIRGLDDSLLTIPKPDLTTAHVTNFGARCPRRFKTRIAVPHGTPPDRLVDFRDGILELNRDHPGTRREKQEVALNDLENSGSRSWSGPSSTSRTATRG